MNALILDDENVLSLKIIQKPSCSGGNDVLVRISYAGLCGIDLHIIKGHFPSAKNIVIGHEIVGVVVSTGEDVTHVKEGDKV